MTIYSLDILLFLFGTSLLFCIQFSLLLPDLHTGFSRGRSGGLVLPSPSEFFTVYCDPHSQRLWHSQWSRNRCFSGTLLLLKWSSGCWQFDLWFLCLFKNQFEHLEFHGSRNAEAWLGEFCFLLWNINDQRRINVSYITNHWPQALVSAKMQKWVLHMSSANEFSIMS